MRIFAYFGVCNGLVTIARSNLTRPVPGRKTWHSRIRGNQRKIRGNTMEKMRIHRTTEVFIGTETLEFLTRFAIESGEYLDVTVEGDRLAVIHIDRAITVLGLQVKLTEEALEEAATRRAAYRASQEAKAGN